MHQPYMVSDVMTRGVYAFAQDTSIETAARVLLEKRISGAPVVSSLGRPLGVVTLAELNTPAPPPQAGYPLFYRVSHYDAATGIEILANDLALGQGHVADVMSPYVLSIGVTAPLMEAAHRMVGEQVHRLLVMDEATLVGIVSSMDILRGLVMQHNRS